MTHVCILFPFMNLLNNPPLVGLVFINILFSLNARVSPIKTFSPDIHMFSYAQY